MREHARRLGRENHGIVARLHFRGVPHKGDALFDRPLRHLFEIGKLVKRRFTRLGVERKVLFPFCDLKRKRRAAGLIIVKKFRAFARIKSVIAMPIRIQQRRQLNFGIFRNDGKKIGQDLFLAIAGDIFHIIFRKTKFFVLVRFKTRDNGVFFDVRVILRQFVQTVQLFLNVVGILRRGVIPHLAVEYPEERSVRQPLLVLGKDTVFIDDGGSTAPLFSYVGIIALSESIHTHLLFILSQKQKHLLSHIVPFPFQAKEAKLCYIIIYTHIKIN